MTKKRLLMVDSDPLVTELMSRKFAQDAPQYDLCAAHSVSDCLKQVDEGGIDCILADIGVYRSNNVCILDALRDKKLKVPVIFVTGDGSNAEMARDAFKRGAFDFITKESALEHFSRLVNSVDMAVRHSRADEKRHAAELRLTEEKNKLEAVIAGMGDGVCILDREYRAVYMNSVYERLSGSELGDRCYEAVQGKDGICEGCPVEEMFKDGRIHRYENTKARRSEGLVFEVVASPILGDEGEVIGAVKLVRDITERKKAEEILIRSEARYREAEAIAGMGSWEWLAAEDQVVWTDGLLRIFGIGRDEFGHTYRSYLDFVHPEDKEEVMRLVQDSLSSGARLQYETRITRADGVERHIQVYGDTTFDGEGRPVKMFGTVQDVTERVLAEKQKADLYAMIRHDMKTPLSIISGNAETLIRENIEILGKESTGMLEVIKRSATNLSRMIEDLVAVSRLEDSSPSLDIRPVDVLELLLEVSANTRGIAEAKGLTLKRYLPDGRELKVSADYNYLLRALTNLVQNAVNYTPEGGRVELSADEKDGFMELSVSDTGRGIPPLDREKVFRKYYRAADAQSVPGTGLGLAIVKAVAEAHGGRVEVADAEGGGSRFTMFIPLR